MKFCKVMISVWLLFVTIVVVPSYQSAGEGYQKQPMLTAEPLVSNQKAVHFVSAAMPSKSEKEHLPTLKVLLSEPVKTASLPYQISTLSVPFTWVFHRFLTVKFFQSSYL